MKIALVGNQNSGKSTLFNTLTGLNQKIGNWPGVTIEKKSGIIKNTDFELIDLPGIYSLNPYTMEEKITTNFLMREKYDVIINIIDCSSISRGLYLTTQLLELMSSTQIIVALNMHEIASKKGIYIDENILSQELKNISVIKISAVTGEGIEGLMTRLENFNKNDNKIFSKNKCFIVDENAIKRRYDKIDYILKKAQKLNSKKEMTLTDKLDKIFLNKILAIPIFVLIMFAIYFISIEVVGDFTMTKLQNLFENVSNNIEKYLLVNEAWPALTSLIVDGILSGVSAVISFLPQLAFLFIMISFLEKVGYMSRISLIFDKIFKKLGMSGNSVISFILGTGCSVPGIMATRTIKNEKEKQITSVLTPFIPCSAKLPIISLFSSYFFRENAGIVAISFYLLSIVIIVVSSIIWRNLDKSTKKIDYIAELPEYRMPKVRQVLKDSFEKVWDFFKRAGSIIVLSSIVVWFLLSFNNKFEYGINIQESLLADFGRSFSWTFVPMVGKNSWEIAVSSIQGLIAKEQVISSMSIIAGLDDENISNNIFAIGSPFAFFSPSSAYAYVAFNLFSAPCFGAISAMRKTLGSSKNMLKAVGYQIGIAYIISCLINMII